MNSKKEKDFEYEKSSSSRQVALCGVFIALAMILSYLENLIPINMAVPGVKLGLANLITILALQRLGFKGTAIISLGRILLSGVLFGNLAIILYSLSGATCSILIMCLLKKCKVFTVTGISVGGAVAHNFGQIVVAALIMENAHIFYYMAVLAITGTIAGIVIGLLANYLLRTIRI